MYHQIPQEYVWKPNHQWAPRKHGRCIGRMYTTNPQQGEKHYLCILHHIPGAMSFADLKKLPDGTTHKTFKETASAMGLLESDDEWYECMSEAAISFMPKQLHSLFVTVLVFGEPANPYSIWEEYKGIMGENLLRDASGHLYMLHQIKHSCQTKHLFRGH